jgi:hypothetical protein
MNGKLPNNELHYHIRINYLGQVYGEVTLVPWSINKTGFWIENYPPLDAKECDYLFNPPERLGNMKFSQTENLKYDTAKDLIIVCDDAKMTSISYFQFLSSWVDINVPEEKEYIEFVNSFVDKIIKHYYPE